MMCDHDQMLFIVLTSRSAFYPLWYRRHEVVSSRVRSLLLRVD